MSESLRSIEERLEKIVQMYNEVKAKLKEKDVEIDLLQAELTEKDGILNTVTSKLDSFISDHITTVSYEAPAKDIENIFQNQPLQENQDFSSDHNPHGNNY